MTKRGPESPIGSRESPQGAPQSILEIANGVSKQLRFESGKYYKVVFPAEGEVPLQSFTVQAVGEGAIDLKRTGNQLTLMMAKPKERMTPGEEYTTIRAYKFGPKGHMELHIGPETPITLEGMQGSTVRLEGKHMVFDVTVPTTLVGMTRPDEVPAGVLLQKDVGVNVHPEWYGRIMTTRSRPDEE
ncbi:hypothetical protein COU80_04895 [Candidatus Peregrinibacteria bacterium CG10_big_fil_rev_8_21_14_0_10_55_24]|nr:MAG: hypothetical protein COU80_04895 [Candidatus Peregrinibacteria bacterium CG10_big_fil_rev_8_21_14_0_10_55_24]